MRSAERTCSAVGAVPKLGPSVTGSAVLGVDFGTSNTVAALRTLAAETRLILFDVPARLAEHGYTHAA